MTVHPDRLRSSHKPAATNEPDPTVLPWRHSGSRAVESAGCPPRGHGFRAFTGRAVSYLATVVLLLLTLAVGFMAILQQPLEEPGEPRWTPALVRAIKTGPGTVDDVVLAEAIFGLDQLPA